MSSAGRLLLDEPRQAAVDVLPLGRRQPLVEDRREQRMRETNRAARHFEDVLVARRLERVGRDARVGELRGRQPRVRGRQREHLAGGRVEAVKAGCNELLQLLRHTQRLRRVALGAFGSESAPQLERVERVSARGLVQPEQGRPRHPPRQQRVKDLMRRADAERPDRQPLDPIGGECVLDVRAVLSRPARPDQRDADVVRPAESEAERGRRGRIEPLEVVDGEHEAFLCERLDRAADRDTERALVDRPPVGVLDEQRHFESAAPRRGQRRQHLVEDPVEKIAEARVGHRPLRLGGARNEYPQAAFACLIDRGPPQRRLADPGLALQRERHRAALPAAPVEEADQ